MLIGSRALAYHIPKYKCREDSDWDFIGEVTVDLPKGALVEMHNIDDLNNKNALHYNNGFGVCSLKGLALIKRSHLWRSHQFDKHIAQYHKWILPHTRLQHYNYRDRSFRDERIRLTKEKFPQGSPNLMQSNQDFFDDAVKKVYDHDWLHELYAHEDEPMYVKMKKPDRLDQAWCEKDMWDNFTYESKVKCVAEECYVIATERFLVHDRGYPKKLAFIKALEKVCTTLCSGWFRDFAIDNYPSVLSIYDDRKVKEVMERLT